MPPRAAPGGYVFHVVNRAIAGAKLFNQPEDYDAFERVVTEAFDRVQMRMLAYCLMPNHWHLVLWPLEDGDLARFMHWLATTHVRRWREYHENVGRGHLYQGRYRSFPVEDDVPCLIVCRYVERNAQTANLVQRAEDWRWCSLWRRLHPQIVEGKPPLCNWPVERPTDWLAFVNEPYTEKEFAALKPSIVRGRPYGSEAWQKRAAKELGLEATMRSRGRPKKKAKKKEPGPFSAEKGPGSFFNR